ncbi:MAG TPA: N-6 DNA methylase [Bacteroidales bacterium]|nr:N-6 DNA methylase [Bacteroidales bacterium]HQG36194.1 N-6 DNA methylase [Bacteroidales bacterium]HQG53475.1 N-6 DNA methylase [Bacteroidales bacterium]HQJ20270.1 N-6 DNA methylase [Bacteroidales bacterium]
MKDKKTGRSIKEKIARIPELREPKWDQTIPEYIEQVKRARSEPAKSQCFTLLLNELFGIQPGFIESYVSGIEKYVKAKQKDRILKGEIDNLFGNLVIEFEHDLTKKLTEAEDQLKRYIACLWTQEQPQNRTPYLCIAADGINFNVYSPVIKELNKKDIQPEEVKLNLIEKTDFSSLRPQDVYFWLDRYFLRKEIFSPKTENIVNDFGIKSHAFLTVQASLLSAWEKVKGKGEFKVVYENWEKYLRIVYGSSVAEEELFCRHTYLSILAKLMVWCRLTDMSYDGSQILSALEGQFFKQQGIENFLEEDFFSWIVRKDAKDIGIEISRKLLSLLQNYNLRELSEDVLKSLYQELVDPETRHDLGEFYTPDWLAHKMIKKLIEQNKNGSFLDPSCGSGTFLYLVIKEKKDRFPETQQTLEHIINSVFGMDIHPLAVIVSKTNYLLALGDLLIKRKGRISIPVYLSDAIRLPEKWMKTEGADYQISIYNKIAYLPEKLLEDFTLYDKSIDAAREFAIQNIGKKSTESQFINFIKNQYPDLMSDTNIAKALFHIAETLRDFIEQDQDTIWAFILKNIYKPLFLKDKFDFVIGNPPWLSFRYADPEYQKFLKEQITKNYKLLSGRGELITHLELATLFLLRTADLYLKNNGTISFVLPRSIFTADQHDALRQGIFKGVNLIFREIWDLESTKPLFNVPSCVLIAQKHPFTKVTYPIPGQKLSGKLENRNASLDEAENSLLTKSVEFYLHKRGKRSFWATEKQTGKGKESYYKKQFFQGATIVPRCFWFVEVKGSPLGFNPNLPLLESSERSKKEAKKAYKGLVMKGNVESQFLYATLLSTDLLPFGYLDYRLIVLPAEQAKDHYKLITINEARNRGFYNLANWLEKAQAEWEKRRGMKANNISAIEWLNYRGKLTSQNPQAKYYVLYNTSGTYICACVIDNEPIEFNIGGQSIIINKFIVESVTYFIELDNEKEAYYIASILNAPTINKMIKPMQARGLWGARHIHKKVLELPIPQFNPSDNIHLQLAELGRHCNEKVAQWVQSGVPGKIKSIGILRSKVREMLKKELNEIDSLVEKILKTR